MAKLLANFAWGILSSSVNDTATTLNSAEFTRLPVVASPDTLTIILDPDESAGDPEIAHVTAHAADSTSVTVVRGTEGTTARSHGSSIKWLHGLTKDFLDEFGARVRVSATAPVDPEDGELWIDTNEETAELFASKDYVDTTVDNATGPMPLGELGYAQTTSDQLGMTSEVDLDNLSLTLDIPADRKIKITCKVEVTRGDGGASLQVGRLRIYQDSSPIQGAGGFVQSGSSGNALGIQVSARLITSGGEQTYKATYERLVGDTNHSLRASAARPSFLLVEDMGPA